MVHFPGLARTRLWIQRAVPGFQPGGFPHSEIPGSKGASPSPRLIAGSRVLRRRLAPRHPPYALSSLTIKSAQHTTTGVRSQNSGVRSSAELFLNPAAFPEPRVPSLQSRPRLADPLMLPRPDPLRTGHALVDTALSVVKDLRVSKATRVTRDLISRPAHRPLPADPDAGFDSPRHAGELRTQPPQPAPQPQSCPRSHKPAAAHFSRLAFLLGDEGLETGGRSYLGRRVTAGKGPLASNPYPKAFRVSTSWEFQPNRGGEYPYAPTFFCAIRNTTHVQNKMQEEFLDDIPGLAKPACYCESATS